MKILKVEITNFRNINNVSVPLNNVTTIIGNNNSGKSNFIRAITLPLLSEDLGSGSKRLNWADLGNESKEKYYTYINDNKMKILNEEIDLIEFKKNVPTVSVKITWKVNESEHYMMKDFLVNTPLKPEIEYSLQYKFYCKNPKELLNHVKKVLNKIEKDDNIEGVKLNLLPIDLFTYTICVPYKDKKVSYDLLESFTYNSVAAERDEFSNGNTRLGSKSLIKLLNNKLSTEDMINIEKQYLKFFDEIKEMSNMEEILNWQEYSEISNAKDFFNKISVLPNMPPMTSLLNSVKLGYDEDALSTQGLGYRNLILQLVMINSLMEANKSIYSLLTIEEPEAHLCYRNEQIMKSYIAAIAEGKEDIQLLYSTHSLQFINKLDLTNIILFDHGEAYSFSEIFTPKELDYLARNPNLDIFKLFYSKSCILVEGITEELLIKSYLSNQKRYLNDVEVISFHKGFTKIIDLWLKINRNSSNKLGIIRDYDDEPKAKSIHEKYNYSEKNIIVATTNHYTLEDEIVNQGENYKLLKTYFEEKYMWTDIDTSENLASKWKGSKGEVMLSFCRDLTSNDLRDIKLPQHISKVLKELGVTVEDHIKDAN